MSAALLPVIVQLRSCSVAALKIPPPGASALSVASARVLLPLTVTSSSAQVAVVHDAATVLAGQRLAVADGQVGDGDARGDLHGEDAVDAAAVDDRLVRPAAADRELAVDVEVAGGGQRQGVVRARWTSVYVPGLRLIVPPPLLVRLLHGGAQRARADVGSAFPIARLGVDLVGRAVDREGRRRRRLRHQRDHNHAHQRSQPLAHVIPPLLVGVLLASRRDSQGTGCACRRV